jgi:hypothetical protein
MQFLDSAGAEGKGDRGTLAAARATAFIVSWPFATGCLTGQVAQQERLRRILMCGSTLIVEVRRYHEIQTRFDLRHVQYVGID